MVIDNFDNCDRYGMMNKQATLDPASLPESWQSSSVSSAFAWVLTVAAKSTNYMR